MKNVFLLLMWCLALHCFADEPQPPAPSKPDGMIGGYEYVNLGLPSGTLWATYNVGATSPYEKGNYFAWGEVEPREDFTWEDYKFYKGVECDPNNGSWAILEDIGNNICGTRYDAARYQWGNGWRLPNAQERYELRMLCWYNYTTENGVPGVRIYGPNEHSIFLPGCGSGLWYGEKDIFYSTDSMYWTGEISPETGYNGRPIEPSNKAECILVQYGSMQSEQTLKACGICIRAVINPKESGIDDVISNVGNDISYSNGCIHIIGSSSGGMVNVHDLSGRLICSGSVADGICRLSGFSFSAGIYIVSYTNGGNTVITIK